MASAASINLEKIARFAQLAVPVALVTVAFVGHFFSFYFHFLTVTLLLLFLLDLYYRHGQKEHALLTNFGFLAQARYLTESIGPELRQYLFSDDLTERPFNRLERAEVYRKAKGQDSTAAFGSQMSFEADEVKLRHSMYPTAADSIAPFELTVGEERGLSTAHILRFPVMISAMSYGALSVRAVRALARGAKKSGITMNTGEGGYPKHHLEEGCDLTFQMGTAKFGVRNEDGSLHEEKLHEIAQKAAVKMVEIKLSQGAKPGKGGILPKEKISEEISELRGVPMDRDVISPPHHLECTDASSTVRFIRRVQEAAGIPVGIKLCLGHPGEFEGLVREMKSQGVFPDYISIDGAEGGTGAAPRSFMDDIGLPLHSALPAVVRILRAEGVRDRLKLFCAGKLISPARQVVALSLGADAVYTARGFMLALGCIQALQCNANTCPVGITTQNPSLVRGLDVEQRSQRVRNYVDGLHHDHVALLSSLGCGRFADLSERNLFAPALAGVAAEHVHHPMPTNPLDRGSMTVVGGVS